MQVAFSPISPGTFLTCQAGRAVRIANYAGVACSTETSVDPSTGQEVAHRVSRPLNSAPKWMRRKCCARFGWGGKLAFVRPPVGRDTTRAVVICAASPEPELKVHSERFESAMDGDLRSYCKQKAEEEDGPEADYWSFIQVNTLAQFVDSARCAHAVAQRRMKTQALKGLGCVAGCCTKLL